MTGETGKKGKEQTFITGSLITGSGDFVKRVARFQPPKRRFSVNPRDLHFDQKGSWT